jgi:hypothetical protein
MGKFPATGYVELAIHATEVGLDGFAGDEQGLRDLGVAPPLRGQLGHAPLRGGELLQSARVRVGGRPASGTELGASAPDERARRAASGEIEPLPSGRATLEAAGIEG